MRHSILLIFIIFMISNVHAIEPFKADCEELERHRYDANNLSSGNSWTVDGKWWIKDTIIWNGDDYVLVNYGKMKAKLITADEKSLRAMYFNRNNTYLLTMSRELGQAILTQHQINPWRGNGMMTRTAALNCAFSSIDAD